MKLFETAVKNIVNATERGYEASTIDKEELQDTTYTYENGILLSKTGNIDMEISGKKIKNGMITIYSDGNVSFVINDEEHCASKAKSSEEIIIQLLSEGECSISGVKQIAAGGYHTFFLMNDGTVKATGTDYGYEEGADQINGTTPVPVDISGVKQIVAGDVSTVFLMNDGTVKVGEYNIDGVRGNINPSYTVDISGVKQIAAGRYYIVFLMNNGTVKAVGYNDSGQLGDGTTEDRSTPVNVMINDTTPLSGVVQIVAGKYSYSGHTVFLMNDGTVMAVGWNEYGQLGDGTTEDRSTPVSVNISGVKQISAGSTYTIFLMNDGTVKATGRVGEYDGEPVNITTPGTIPISGVKQISAGGLHTVFLMNEGTVMAVGWNAYGQLGDGTTEDRSTPVPVNISGVKQVSAGLAHTLFLMDDVTVMAVGKNDYGSLGDGTTINRSTPVLVNLSGS